MAGAKLLGLARRVEGIAEAKEAGDPTVRMELIRQQGGDAPAHGLAADDQRAWSGQRLDRGAELGQQPLRLRRRLARPAAAGGHVGELEAGDPKALARQRRREAGQRRRVHGRAGAVGKQQRRHSLSRAIEEKIHRLAPVQFSALSLDWSSVRYCRGWERRYWSGAVTVLPRWAAACHGQRGL